MDRELESRIANQKVEKLVDANLELHREKDATIQALKSERDRLEKVFIELLKDMVLNEDHDYWYDKAGLKQEGEG